MNVFKANKLQLDRKAQPVFTWIEIWKNNETLNRTYNADFEVYNEKSQKGKNKVVEIYIGVKP